MIDLDLNTLVLSWVTTYGAPMVAIVLFLGALGLPVPGTLLVIAAGAFVRQNFLDVYTTPVWGLTGSVAGDIVVYGVGRLAHHWIQRRFGTSAGWNKAQDFFEQRGGLAIYLTRWLVTPLALPVTLIAGGSGYPFAKFLLAALSGELTWIILYGGLGYAFGSQWELISEFISQFSGFILGAVVMAAGLYLLIRLRKPAPKSEPIKPKVSEFFEEV
jgi:membrane protein DedA with SNARE-associated domain